MTRIVLDSGQVLFDSYEDLRGNQTHKNIEKAHGPGACWKDGSLVMKCPMCPCLKSYDPEVPNKIRAYCDGECPCHDGIKPGDQ